MFADIYFVVHGETIPAHRVILAARSSYFAEMLQTEWQEKMVFFPRTAEVGALTAFSVSSCCIAIGSTVPF
jgi:hypothetical protein